MHERDLLFSCTNQNNHFHDLAVSALLSFVLKKTQRAKYFPPSVLKFGPIASVTYVFVEPIKFLENPDATYDMDQQSKAVGVCST